MDYTVVCPKCSTKISCPKEMNIRYGLSVKEREIFYKPEVLTYFMKLYPILDSLLPIFYCTGVFTFAEYELCSTWHKTQIDRLLKTHQLLALKLHSIDELITIFSKDKEERLALFTNDLTKLFKKYL